jgi:hypothetical protein
VPGGDGAFVVAHADGNLYVYEKVSLPTWKKLHFIIFHKISEVKLYQEILSI